MGALRHDVRYALRALRSSPGFAAVAIITIALAVGSNTALFSFVNGMVLNPLPYADADRIVRLLERRPDRGLKGGGHFAMAQLDTADYAKLFIELATEVERKGKK